MEVAAPQERKVVSVLTGNNAFKIDPIGRQEQAAPDGGGGEEVPAQATSTRSQDVHPQEKAPVTGKKAGAETSNDLTDEDRALLGLEEAPADDSPAWDDTHKRLFKEVTGSDDPGKFREEYAKLKEEHTIHAKNNAELKSFHDRISKLDPRVQRAIQLEMGEKGAGQKYLTSQPPIDLLGKDAKKIGDRQILDMHISDHGITEEQWALLNDPDADPGEQDALKRRIGFLRANAEDMHKKAQSAFADEEKAEAEAARAEQERFNEAVASTIAHAKNGPMKAFLTAAHEEEVRTGKFLGRFFQNDGISPKPELLDIILKAEKYDSMKEAARKAMYKQGRSDGAQEIMAGMPATPRNGRAVNTQQQQKTNPYSDLLDRIEKGAR